MSQFKLYRMWAMVVTAALLVALGLPTALADEWVRGAFRVLTNVSAGKNNFHDVAEIAREKDLDFVVFTDQFIVRGEIGLPPFRNVMRYAQERRSIKTFGCERYLREISAVQREFPDLLLIPGADVAPIYEWSGSPFHGTLMGRRWSEQITVLGNDSVKFLENLPAIHNDPLGVSFPGTIPRWLPLALAVLGCWMIYRGTIIYWGSDGKKQYVLDTPRIVIGALLCVFGLIWWLDNRPFHKTSPYSQYQDNGLQPFQTLIDYVKDHDAIAFWAHPEMKMKVQYGPFLFDRFGTCILETKPYLYDALDIDGHNGMAGLYGDAITAHLPGNVWDKMLEQYCHGKRTVLPVIVGELDYHADRPLDLILTVAQVKETSSAALLHALKNGSSYAVGGELARYFLLDKVTLSDSNQSATLGGSLATTAETMTLRITGKWDQEKAGRPMDSGTVYIIANGRLVATPEIREAPFTISESIPLEAAERQYIRFYIRVGSDILLANPIFVERRGG